MTYLKMEAILKREVTKYQTDLDRCIKTYKNSLHNNIDFKCISIFKPYTSLYNNYAKVHRIPREKVEFYQDIRSSYNNCCGFSDKEFMLDPSSFIR